MRRSRYVTVLLIGAAATAMAGCDQDVKGDATVYGDTAACTKDNDSATCNEAFKVAKEEHVKQAPKFTSKAECEAAGFTQCEAAPVEGTRSTGMFMPMMAGFMMGRMMGGMGGGMGMPPGAARPVFSDRNGYLYANGTTVGRVAPGTASLGSNAVPARSVARGGFGGSARSFGGGS